MTSTDAELLEARYRRRAALAGAAVIAAFLPFDLQAGVDPRATAARAIWVVTLVAFGLSRPWPHHLDGDLVAVISGLAMAVIGWSNGPLFLAYLYVLPFAAMVVFFRRLRPVLLVGVTSLVAGGWAMVARGEPPASTLRFLAALCASIGVAAWGSQASRKHDAAVRASLEGQRQALEALVESELRRARSERLAVVGQLAAGVAHEINNPLSYAKSSLDWIRAQIGVGAGGDAPATAELREALEDAEHGIQRIQRVVADLGAFARGRDDEACGCDVAGAVGEASRLASLRVRDCATLACEVEDGLWQPTIQPSRLVQVLLNLLINAADAVEGRHQQGRIELRARRRDGLVVLEVEDDGPGFDDAIATHLFEPFFTTKGTHGTGLGLALSKEYVERAGGMIQASRGPLGGALFTIELPACVAPPPTLTPAPDRTSGIS